MNQLWSTPVFKGIIKDKDLLERLLQSMFLNVNLDAPVNDFQDFDILNEGPKEFIEFKEKIVYTAFEDYIKRLGHDIKMFNNVSLRSWITGVRNGYMIPVHNHSGASFSAVFYLLCENDKEGGELLMVDPRANANRGYKDQFKDWFSNKSFLPQSGEYIIFPSYLYHHTLPFTGKMRIAMPVDLYL
jgi:hypothetical protein